ncbi:NTP transferase domain-containing protein [Reichenbachiella versicolor]|uniref:NTP transferase domain-containing protein n=1 Tax=Reichenbachiella versicolor TaxID=1821036 RepID=UPI001C8754DB|nr:NTP transferase domain-containing protein [Reichenbachiella versicolor]
MSKKHQKHAKLTKPDLGYFARNEISILGAPCGEIQRFAIEISYRLGDDYKIAFIDADHKSVEDESNLAGSSLAKGMNLEFIDKIDFARIDTLEEQNDFNTRQTFNSQDLVIVNGNHFKANQQIIILDSRKPLNKKLDKLTNVIAIISEPNIEVPKYLKDHLRNSTAIPRFDVEDLEGIAEFIDTMMVSRVPELNGLVLSGGKSQRMMRDKTVIEYHGKEQKDYMLDIMTPLVSTAFLSIREDQKRDEVSNEITDKFIGLGPYGAILSAFMSNPNRAWLVTAADQPFLSKSTLEFLIEQRNPSKVATAFYNPETDFPEPLVTIWEPRAYPIMLNYLSQGYSCPRKVLINSEIELVKLEDASVLDNVNTPEQYEAAIERLKSE